MQGGEGGSRDKRRSDHIQYPLVRYKIETTCHKQGTLEISCSDSSGWWSHQFTAFVGFVNLSGTLNILYMWPRPVAGTKWLR